MGRTVWRALFILLLAAQAGWSTAAVANTRYAALVMDADTGEVIFSRKADHKRHPASLTKMMTLYMLFEALDRGELELDDRLLVSKHAWGQAPSKLGLEPGDTIGVEEAILAMVTKSANDVAVVIAEALGVSEWKFAKQMTRRARALGMSKTTFRNASGLYHRKQRTTARDMGLLARRLHEDFPEYYQYFSVVRFEYGNRRYKNHNRLLVDYAGTDGIKTGYIRASGFNLVASVSRDGRRLIAVVFGGRSARTRDKHMRELLDNGFARLASREQDDGPVHATGGSGTLEKVSSTQGRKSLLCVERDARLAGQTDLPFCPG